MAIITVSRQLSSLGDEISQQLAKNLGYKFFGKKEIEARIVELGFPESKLSKFDERRVGFLTALTRTRDEYLNYLVTAILEAASENNCVIVGRGSFIILKDLANHISCRFIADENLRKSRLKNELDCQEKLASKKIIESENQQKSFYKGLFNFNIHDPAMFDLIINTSSMDVKSISASIEALSKNYITEEKNIQGQKKIDELLIGQRIVNMLIFDYNLAISFLRISMEDKKITLHGVAESPVVIDSALAIVSGELPDFEIESAISVTQDFRTYGQ